MLETSTFQTQKNELCSGRVFHHLRDALQEGFQTKAERARRAL